MELCQMAPFVVLLRCYLSLYTSHQNNTSGPSEGTARSAGPAASETERDSMRRQKRDMNSRAYDRGYQAGVSGRSQDICPHTEEEHRQNWLTGWREGRCDQWDGLTGISGVHKIRAV